ncbi:hypothetical protein [Ruminococcus albus]|uniref:Uncharacterized protein n=1 Tax=Ruminococcus albus TaxID=1264 RepID=A0A1I1GHP3_RUMAL|nr:hypothetical protein [Ruminococcus albus]SFC11041.1 hypothetical protein SAMN02910406_01179 [Ruminococcus albus]
MVENGTLIEKIEKHPRLWCTAAAVITLVCLLSGLMGFLVKSEADINNIDKAPVYGHAGFEITDHDKEEDFEIINSFCRYIPTGSEYFYRVCTEDGTWLFVRADKDADFDKKTVIDGKVRKFSGEEKKYLLDKYALNMDNYIDMTWLRISLLQIASGLLMAFEILLGAAMIKDKISAESKMRKAAEIVFCALPFPFAAIWIYLLCHI